MALQYATVKSAPVYIQEINTFAFLDEVTDMLNSGKIGQGMRTLGKNLYDLYAGTSTNEWLRIVNSKLLNHTLNDLLAQDPFTARAFKQPRGYAGDAVLLDMAYFPNKIDLSNVSSLGRKIFGFNSNVSIAHALRNRITAVANIIDKSASISSKLKVLSVACGHCREAEYSHAIRNRQLSTFAGIDQDSKSLAFAKLEYKKFDIDINQLNISDIIRGRADLGKFDLIYSAGLYDYLGTRTAQRLTKELFNLLSSGGKLVIFNITKDYPEIGYFESYMNWPMIGRDEFQVAELASKLPLSDLNIVNVDDEEKSTYYHSLEIQKN